MNSAVNFNFSVPVERQKLDDAVHNVKEVISEIIAEINNLTEEKDATVKRDTTPCDIIDLSWLFQEKCKMIDKIKEKIINVDNSFETNGESFTNLYEILVKENIEQKQALENIKKDLEPQEDNLAKMKKFLHKIELSENAAETCQMNTPEMLDINLLRKNSKEKLDTMRKNFHKLLDFDVNLKDLIHDLTQAYFQGGDSKYIDVSDTSRKKYSPLYINLIKMCDLIVVDPYNNSRIKFDDII